MKATRSTARRPAPTRAALGQIVWSRVSSGYVDAVNAIVSMLTEHGAVGYHTGSRNEIQADETCSKLLTPRLKFDRREVR